MSFHFFGSLVYLLLTTALVSCYFLGLIGLFVFFRRGRKKSSSKRTKRKQISERDQFLKLSVLIVTVILAFNASIYTRQRVEWMGADNTHLKAKEYFVAGQVLDFYRSLATSVLHPENILLRPLNILQENIYNVGSKLLPENDGEIGIWLNGWLIYPYSKRFLIPKGYSKYTNDQLIAPMLVEYLDKVWFSIEVVATNPIADKQMYEQHYLRNFAGMVHYYAYNKRGYAPGNNGSDFYLSKISEHIKRSELMISWLIELKSRWGESGKVSKFVDKNPVVEVMREVAMIIEFSFITLGRIYSDEFSCDDPTWLFYSQIRDEFAIGYGGQPAIQRMKNRKEAKQYHYVAMESVAAKFDSYILHKYCGIALPGEIDWSEEKSFRHKGETLNDSIESRFTNIYQSEFEKLEEQFNGNQ